MTQRKPTNKGKSRKTPRKNTREDKYKLEALKSWQDDREPLISSLSANISLPSTEKTKKPSKRKAPGKLPIDITPS